MQVRIDLHVHSEHSDRPYSWFMKDRSAECYTKPAELAVIARARGMNLVTITDHDTIDGALRLRELDPSAFLSEEVSARFPEDGNILHVMTLDIDEAQHLELQRLRGNIYELAQYLEAEQIPHFVCHPLSAVNGRLRHQHVERALLMFRNVELRNGTRDASHETTLRRLLAELSPARLAEWAERHPQAPWINRDARWAVVGGSDDHGRIGIARAFTSFEGECSAAGLRLALAERRTSPGGEPATPRTLAHNVYGVLHGYLSAEGRSTLVSLAAPRGGSRRLPEAVKAALETPDEQGRKLTWERYRDTGHTEEFEAYLHGAISGLLRELHRGSLGELFAAVSQVDLARIIDSLPDILKGMLLELPVLLAARYHARDRRTARELGASLGVAGARPPLRVAVLSDTVDDVNGVALGLRRLAATARAEGLDLRVLGLAVGDSATRAVADADGIVRLPALRRHRLREYPSMEFGIPHLPALLDYLIDEEITLVQVSTPGPVGLAGLVAARLCGLPVIGQFHTDVPEYAKRLTGDHTVGGIVARLVGLFYGQVDQVLVPTQAIAERVKALGVDPTRVRLVPRGVDLELFQPVRRDEHAFAPWGLNGEPKVLYVGRISREKGLDALVEGFVRTGLEGARLVMVGDGPYREPLRQRAEQGRVIFTGELTGEELARLYASADLFVCPSETETFGNVVVEAQASGLPVIVTRLGGAAENVVEGVTGMVVDGADPDALAGAMRQLLCDAELRRRMGQAAREWSHRYAMPAAARGTFRVYEQFLRDQRGAGA